MGNPNRTALIGKAHRVLKQHYKPVMPPDRPVLEHLLFGCCLENAPPELAEKVFDQLAKHFFDWNEVRVSTVTELAEAMRALPDPQAAGSNIKRVLQGVFESSYSFELESLRKQSIGQGAKLLEKLGGASAFNVGYVTQAALGGHVIPLDRGALEVLAILGIVSPAEAASGKVTGLERAIPKNKGPEFASLLHQLGADYLANPFSPNVRKLLLSINPESKDRFPKRSTKKEPEPAPPPAAPVPADHGKKKGEADHKLEKSRGEKPKADKPETAPPPPAGKSGRPNPIEKQHVEKAHAEKSHTDKAHAAKAQGDKQPADKPPSAKERLAKANLAKHKSDAAARHEKTEKHEKTDKREKHPAPEKRKPAATSHKPLPAARPHAVTTKRKSTTKQLSKRKPR
jgi:endonuclease-3